MARDRDELRSGALRRADLLECGRAVRDDAGDVGERLDVVDDGGHLVEALHGQPRRTVARIAALALERREEPGGLAADIRSGAAVDDDVAGKVGAEDALAEIAGCVGFLDRAREPPVGQVELAADVDERVADLQRYDAISIDSSSRCGACSRIQRSLNVPGSPSSAFAHRKCG